MKKILSVATFLFVAIIASASLSPTGPDGGEYFILVVLNVAHA